MLKSKLFKLQEPNGTWTVYEREVTGLGFGVDRMVNKFWKEQDAINFIKETT